MATSLSERVGLLASRIATEFNDRGLPLPGRLAGRYLRLDDDGAPAWGDLPRTQWSDAMPGPDNLVADPNFLDTAWLTLVRTTASKRVQFALDGANGSPSGPGYYLARMSPTATLPSELVLANGEIPASQTMTAAGDFTFPLAPGKSYRVGMWIKGTGTFTQRLAVYVDHITVMGTALVPVALGATIIPAAAWTWYEWDYTAPVDAVAGVLRVVLPAQEALAFVARPSVVLAPVGMASVPWTSLNSGPDNLIADPTFTSADLRAVRLLGASAGVSFALNDTTNGSASGPGYNLLKLDSSGGKLTSATLKNGRNYVDGSVLGGGSAGFPLIPGESYRLGMWVKATGTIDDGITVGIQHVTSWSTTSATWQDIVTRLVPTNAWTWREWVFTCPQNTVGGYVYLGGNTGEGAVYVARPSLVHLTNPGPKLFPIRYTGSAWEYASLAAAQAAGLAATDVALFLAPDGVAAPAWKRTGDVVIAYGSTVSQANAPEEIGSIKPWPTLNLPARMADTWMLMDGRAISRTTYAELFAMIGTTFGAGDGSTTFNLPSAKGRVIVGLAATNPFAASIGQYGGEYQHTMTIEELVGHAHAAFSGQFVLYDGGTTGAASGTSGGSKLFVNGATASAGGGQAFNIMQPYVVMPWIIKVARSAAEAVPAPGHVHNSLEIVDFSSRVDSLVPVTSRVHYLPADQTTFTSASPPSAYGDGSTVFSVEGTGSWPAPYAIVETIRTGIGRCIQRLTAHDGTSYQRSANGNGTDTWNAWTGAGGGVAVPYSVTSAISAAAGDLVRVGRQVTATLQFTFQSNPGAYATFASIAVADAPRKVGSGWGVAHGVVRNETRGGIGYARVVNNGSAAGLMFSDGGLPGIVAGDVVAFSATWVTG
jgi:microcystin-dependent protein